MKITFRFKSLGRGLQSRVGARGRQSATQRIRHEQTLRRSAEEHATGEAAHWRTVYSLMRCPGCPCRNNQGYCWRDPHGGKHHKLLSAHLIYAAQIQYMFYTINIACAKNDTAIAGYCSLRVFHSILSIVAALVSCRSECTCLLVFLYVHTLIVFSGGFAFSLFWSAGLSV